MQSKKGEKHFYLKYLVKKNGFRKVFGKKMACQKTFLVQKKSGSKKVWVQNDFEPKKFWMKRNLESKEIRVQKIWLNT